MIWWAELLLGIVVLGAWAVALRVWFWRLELLEELDIAQTRLDRIEDDVTKLALMKAQVKQRAKQQKARDKKRA